MNLNRALSAPISPHFMRRPTNLPPPGTDAITVNTTPNWHSDDDADGGVRLLEYALGAQPLIPDAKQMCLAAEVADDHLRLRFPRRFAETSELTYTLQSSTNLVNWTG